MVLAKVLGAQVRWHCSPPPVRARNSTLARCALREDCRCGCRRRAAPTCCRYTTTRCRSSHRGPAPTSTAFFIVRAAATGSASIVDCAVSPCSPTIKLVGALASITMYDEEDLPLSELLHQLASEKAASLKPPCL